MQKAKRINAGNRGHKGELVGVLRVAEIAARAGELTDHGRKIIARIGATSQDVAVVVRSRGVHAADAYVHAKHISAGGQLQIGEGLVRKIKRVIVHVRNDARELVSW